MSLTPTQAQALVADIATAFPGTPNTDDDNAALAILYNQVAFPAFIVWKTTVPTRDIKDSMNWTEYISRSAAERGAFEMMISDGSINPSRPNVRQGVADIFSGVGAAPTALRAAILALSKRSATRAEKLFAVGTGSDASPATMTFEGFLTYQDVSQARSS